MFFEKRGLKLYVTKNWIKYFMSCESELIYRIWNLNKNKIIKISTIRVDDEKQLNDL